MAGGIKVAALFASLGIDPDIKSWSRAREQLKGFARDAEHDMKPLRARLGGAVRSALGAKVGTVRGLMFNPITAGVAAVGAATAVAAKDALSFEDALTDLDISGSGAAGSLASVREKVLAVSGQVGIAKEEILRGAQSFVTLTGDGKGAIEMLDLFARANAGGKVAMEDAAGVAAALRMQMGITNAEMEKAFSIITRSGKAGKVEFKDMGALIPSLGAAFNKFAGSQGIGGLTELSSAFQIAARGFGNQPAEAATALESLFRSIVQHAGKLEKAGVQVFDKDPKTGVKTLRDFFGIVDAIGESDLMKDPTKLQDALGRVEAMQAFQQLHKYRNEWVSIGQATRGANDIAEDFNRRQQSSAYQVKKAWNDVKVAVADAFTPERIQAFAMAIKSLISLATDAATAVASIVTGSTKVRNENAERVVDNLLRGKVKLEDIASGKMRSIVMRQVGADVAAVPEVEQAAKRRLAAAQASDARVASFRAQKAALTAGAALSPALALGREAATVASRPAPADYVPGEGVTITNQVTVHAPGGDGAEIAGALRRQLESFWNSKMRHVLPAGR